MTRPSTNRETNDAARGGFAPALVQRRALSGPRTRAELLFAWRCFVNDSSNFAMFQYRDFQGFILTAKNSGTHWLTYALNLALAEQYGVPPPRFSDNASCDDIIGHPKHKRIHPQLPRVASAHSIPSKPLDRRFVRRLVKLPRYVVVVRDMRDALSSYYVKWHAAVPFAEFLAGDPLGRRFRADLWWYIHFHNRWGDVAVRFPEEVLVARYEDLIQAQAAGLERIAAHLGLTLTPQAIDAAVKGSSKEAMLLRRDPAIAETVIRIDGAQSNPAFGPEETAIFRRIIDANLKYDFGYDYWAS